VETVFDFPASTPTTLSVFSKNLPTVRQAFAGWFPAPCSESTENTFTAQLSLAANGGSGSPVVFNVFWSPLSCSGISFFARHIEQWRNAGSKLAA
jgi:hypothetical protein